MMDLKKQKFAGDPCKENIARECSCFGDIDRNAVDSRLCLESLHHVIVVCVRVDGIVREQHWRVQISHFPMVVFFGWEHGGVQVRREEFIILGKHGGVKVVHRRLLRRREHGWVNIVLLLRKHRGMPERISRPSQDVGG